MRPSPWPEWLDDVLAKSADKGVGGVEESLAQHTWNVLERLADFIRLRPNLPQQLLFPRIWHCLYWAAFLHDFGKAIPAFQGILKGDATARDRWESHRHEVFSLAFLDWIEDNLSAEEQIWTAAAIATHHRDAAELEVLYPLPEPGEDDPLTLQFEGFPEERIEGLHRWLYECGWPWAKEAGLEQFGVEPVRLTGRTGPDFCEHSVRSIRSRLIAFHKFTRRLGKDSSAAQVPFLALRGTIINSDHSASAHADSLPRLIFELRKVLDPLEKKGYGWNDLFQHQREAAETEGSALLTAPTGSGKTEAALLWACRQAVGMAHGLPRLFYTLPYQASMNAMNLRLQEVYGDRHVGLQHGRSLLALYRMLLERQEEPGQAAQQARWSRNLAKLNYPPVRVFSPYQMLKGMYRLKGYEALLTDYHQAAFIFDEIHAYETKRLAMILKTIQYFQENYGARFLMMSATFPSLLKNRLRKVLGAPAEIEAAPDLFQAFRRHRIEVMDGELLDEKNLSRILATAHQAKSVLVACNLVDRAQEAYRYLQPRLNKKGIPVVLLHGRFNQRDRLRKEQQIRKSTGTHTRSGLPIVLVATQVVEVSLDIDLDTIYSDPAPLDALVQRFGRINRGRKLASLAPVHIFRQPDDGHKIYSPELVRRSLAILEREHEKPLEESAVGTWLDEIYVGEVAEEWEKEYDRASAEFEASCIRTLRPFASDPSLEELFYKAFEGLEVLPEAYHSEFLGLHEENPILANELLVPISLGRYHALVNSGQVLPREKRTPPIVRADYSSEVGLLFNRPSEDEDF